MMDTLWKIYNNGRDEINSTSIGSNGEWVIVTNKNDYFTSPNLAESLQSQLKKLKRKGASIREVLMTKDEAWLVLFRE